MSNPEKRIFIAEDDKAIQEWLTKVSWLHFGEPHGEDGAIAQELQALPAQKVLTT